jgi:hypothetical protein
VSSYILPPQPTGFVDRIDVVKRRTAFQHDRFQSNVSINPRRTDEMNKLDIVGRSAVPIGESELSQRRRSRRDSGSQLVNSDRDVSAYENSTLLFNGHHSNSTQSLPHRSSSATLVRRHREDFRRKPDLKSSGK